MYQEKPRPNDNKDEEKKNKKPPVGDPGKSAPKKKL
jgi:hypothetical protein